MKVLITAIAVFVLTGCASTKPNEAYVKAHPELDAETRRRILAGEVVPGMPGEHVLAALGGPMDIRRNADGAEYWEYRSAILVFRNGVLVSWVDKNTIYQ